MKLWYFGSEEVDFRCKSLGVGVGVEGDFKDLKRRLADFSLWRRVVESCFDSSSDSSSESESESESESLESFESSSSPESSSSFEF